jgi:calcium-dependent protein kinase
VYENDLWIFLVQDLCEGGELFFYITQRKHLTENEAALIMKQAFSAI